MSGFKGGEALFPQILELERVFSEYESASRQLLQEELKTALLFRCLPAASRNQVHATLPEDASYSSVRDCVLRIERQQFKWQGVSYFGDAAQGSGAGSGDGAVPMEIDRLAGKGKKGKGKEKGKDSKGKGKQGKDSKGKGKQDKDKGHDNLKASPVTSVLLLISACTVANPAIGREIAESTRPMSRPARCCWEPWVVAWSGDSARSSAPSPPLSV